MPVNPDRDRPRTTLKDIARELGVATSTVSNAYNRPDQLSTELRDTILETAARLGYAGPDPAARSLRRGVTNTIGLLYPSPLSYAFTDPVHGLFIQGIATEVERRGYTLLLVGGPADDSAAAEGRAPLPATAANVDGFIVHCFADGDPLLQAALARNLPTVMVDNHDAGGYPFVAVEDERGAREAARHLLASGHRRLGVISLELALDEAEGIADLARQARAGYQPSRARLRGYRAAVEEAGLPWEGVAVYECADNTLRDGRAAAAALLARRPPPTALLAMSDQLALGALTFTREAGIDVPDDLSLIGFDDIPGAAQANPALTTVHQPHIEKGRHAGRLLLAQLQEEGHPPSVTLETHLVVRGSSAEA